MENRVLLIKTIILLYRESLLGEKSENSADLVRTVLDDVKASEIKLGIGGDHDVITSLKSTILEMCNNPIDHEYDKLELLRTIQINTLSDDKLFDVIKQALDEELTEAGLKRSILSMRKSISNHFRYQSLTKLLVTSANTVRFQREKVKDTTQYIGELMAQLESLQVASSSKDPAIISEIDIGDDSGMGEVMEECKNLSSGDKVYKTGWKGLNRALQGGMRPGDSVVVGALQHSYKTGMTLSVFAQIALFNRPEPFLIDFNKKPLLLRISFEDSMANNLMFLYQYLKFNETRQKVNMKDIDTHEANQYIKEQLHQNGWHVKMIRVDPDQWTYRSIFNKIVEYEAQGYEVKVLMLDYLSKISKAGCINNGMIGGEIADLLSKVRNYCASKAILMITPHQLSTEAKMLARSGMSEDQLVLEWKGKGYWEGNKGLDRIYDIGILLHLFKTKGEAFLAFCVDKHRLPTVIDEQMKYFLYKFPKGLPLPHDEDDEYGSYYDRLKDAFTSNDMEAFDNI